MNAPPEAIASGLDRAALAMCFGSFPEAVVVANRERRLVFLNAAAEELLGCIPKAGEPGPLCSELFHRETTAAEDCFVEQCLRGKENLRQIPVRLRNPEAKSCSLLVSAAQLKDPSGNPLGCLAILRDIEADLRAQPEIQGQLATFSSILNNFPTPFFTVGPDLVITYMNQHLEKLTGYSSAEVVGRMTCASVLCTPQCDSAECVLKQAMESRRPLAGVRRLVKDRWGREIPVVVNASLITDSSGRVIGGFEAFRDISRIVEAEKKIELLTEMTQEGILMADENQRVIFANSKMGEVTGLPKEELIGKPVSRLLSPGHQKMLADLIAEVDQKPLRFCSTVEPADSPPQRKRIFETCMAASRVGNSIITYLYLRDLTGRIEIERQLRRTNNFLNNLIRSSVDGIVVVDTRGKILIFNEGAERILGYTAAEVIGRAGTLYWFYDRQLAREMMRRMRSSSYGPPGKLEPCQIYFTRKDGEKVPVRFSAAIVKEGDREIGSVGIFSDLREHLRMQRQLEEAQRQVVHAAKIASLGRLAAGVAHEINNPLAGILIYADMLLKEVQGKPAWRQDLEEIVNQTLRCKQIVTRLLEFSRQSLGQRLLLDLNATIEQCVKLLANQALFHNIETRLELEADLPQILGDPGELQQVFTNLMLNAADAMGGKGRLKISTARDRTTKEVVAKFADSGPGIAAEDLDKIFEPFFTTKAPGKGTGLGLSVVYGVIQRHGGTVEAESPAGGGTIFTVRLPLKPPEPSSPLESSDAF